MKPLAKTLVSRMAELTARRSVESAFANAQQNTPHVRLTIADLAANRSPDDPDSAIVVAAGPSLHRRHSVAQIRESGYEGTIVAADGALGACLRNGVVPAYVVTLDPHATRICRWFGDPDYESRLDEDDYFLRQDLDPYLATDQRQRNRELIELVNRHGPSIKAVICTSASPSVTKRCLESGMQLYWWNPLLDDVERPESVTKQLYRMNRAPCMVSGGNAGAAAWIVASQVLEKRDVALVGMDLSYPPGTPTQKMQYGKELEEMFGEQADDALIPIENPYLNETWLADPAYYWYRESFLQLAAQARTITHNCTEGGILFGKPVRWSPLTKFLAAHCAVGARR